MMLLMHIIVAIVNVSGVDDTGDKHDDIGTDDAMLLVV